MDGARPGPRASCTITSTPLARSTSSSDVASFLRAAPSRASSPSSSSSAAQGPRGGRVSRTPSRERRYRRRGGRAARTDRRPTQRLPDDVAALVLDDQRSVVARPQVAGVEPGQRVGEVRARRARSRAGRATPSGGRAGRPPRRRAFAGSRARPTYVAYAIAVSSCCVPRGDAEPRAADHAAARPEPGRRDRPELDEATRGTRDGCSSSSRRGSGRRRRRRLGHALEQQDGVPGERVGVRHLREPHEESRGARARRRGARSAPRPRTARRPRWREREQVASVSTALMGRRDRHPCGRAPRRLRDVVPCLGHADAESLEQVGPVGADVSRPASIARPHRWPSHS